MMAGGSEGPVKPLLLMQTEQLTITSSSDLAASTTADVRSLGIRTLKRKALW